MGAGELCFTSQTNRTGHNIARGRKEEIKLTLLGDVF
jgi:hypothetical protein